MTFKVWIRTLVAFVVSAACTATLTAIGDHFSFAPEALRGYALAAAGAGIITAVHFLAKSPLPTICPSCGEKIPPPPVAEGPAKATAPVSTK